MDAKCSDPISGLMENPSWRDHRFLELVDVSGQLDWPRQQCLSRRDLNVHQGGRASRLAPASTKPNHTINQVTKYLETVFQQSCTCKSSD